MLIEDRVAVQHLGERFDSLWPDSMCNKDLDGEFAKFFLTKLSSNVGGGRT